MGGAGFASLFGSQPIIMIQMQAVLSPDTGAVSVNGNAPSLGGETPPTFQFVVTLRPAIQYKTGM